MKKIEKITLRNAEILEAQEMKHVRGGVRPHGSGSYAFCVGSDGIGAGPFANCTDEFCVRYYGSGSHCD